MSSKEVPPTMHMSFDKAELPYVVLDSTNYMPLKPLCELLGVSYEAARRSLHKSPILKHFVREVQVVIKGASTTPKRHLHLHNGGSGSPKKGALSTFQEPAPTAQTRELIALPEQVVYGWMMQLPIRNEEGMVYLWAFYQAMWKHFHQVTSADVRQVAHERVSINRKLADLNQRLADNAVYMEKLQLENRLEKLRAMERKALQAQVRQAELEFDAPKELSGAATKQKG